MRQPFRAVIDKLDKAHGASTLRKRSSAGKGFPLHLLRLLRIAIAVGLISFIFWKIDWLSVLGAFGDVSWLWVVGKFLLAVLAIFLGTIRWKILLNEQGIRLRTSLLFRRMWIARFINSFLPGQAGGDLFRVFGQWGVSLKKTAVASSVLVDRFAGILGLSVLLSFVGLVEYKLAKNLGLGLVPLFSFLGTWILLPFVTTRWPLDWIHRLVPKWQGARMLIAEEVLKSLLVYADRRGAIFAAVVVSVGFRLVSVLSVYCGFRALGVDISLGSVLFIGLLIQAISLIPLSINEWGIREAGFVLLYTQMGVGAGEALSVALLGRLIGVVLATVGGILYIIHR